MMLARPAAVMAPVALALWLWAAPIRAADVPYVTTPQAVVDAMLKIAAVGPNDYLIDLGSGDGRIVITAAKRIGTRGFGVDLDDNLVRTARRNAEKEGVADRVAFHTRNLFDTDISKASVISMYLLNSVNLRLRPSLFKLKPGTRIVSHDFDMGKWTSDAKITIDVPEKSYGPPHSDIFLWVVPADFSGTWRWRIDTPQAQDYEVTFEQMFQVAQGKGRIAGADALVSGIQIRGDEIMFVTGTEAAGKATWREFRGRIAGDTITGSVNTFVESDKLRVKSGTTAWQATRTLRDKMQIDAGTPSAGGERLATGFLNKERQ